ncbi:lactoferrin binding protein A LbpA [Moraxella macacae 0408225]|uniref:Lactoferrin binding protein A LbpA n=1 Tax=Moraxella macacae 0408225 TaxID=1230338 RepID=L2F7K7_9GAMM|nr:lactoferrin/transferrin family TonB-dependent receptor [Moraxella macacae]ELA09012.1 lactoferrin binding protein A LbpA [Moraxella macacae 0408225]
MSTLHNFHRASLNLAIRGVLFGTLMGAFALPVVSFAQTAEETETESETVTTTTKAEAAKPKAEAETPTAHLDALVFTAPTNQVTRFDTDVTGLGKTVKTAANLAKEHVQGIRDLVRYETGISVVEQGRGGSSGFAIHGVDKNRVAITVDGVAQIQSYKDESTKRAAANSGTMNEIEIENITAVAINKGGNALEAGSGALGGSVAFYTKDVSDVLKSGNNIGAQSKTTYNSKNAHFSQTLAAAGKSDLFEAMVQYTHRKSKENSAHNDLANINQSFYRLGAYQDKYDLRKTDTLYKSASYVTLDCLNSANPQDCVQYNYKYTNYKPDSTKGREFKELNDAEKAQYLASIHPQEVVSAKDYTGIYRLLPDPMDYKSDSYLARLNINFKPNLIGKIIVEDTKQQYNVRDMRHCSYHGVKLGKDGTPDSKGSIPCDDYKENIDPDNSAEKAFRPGKNDVPIPKLAYAKSSVFNQAHKKTRYGAALEFKPNVNWFKNANLNVNQQTIQINNHDIKKSCSTYPNVDLNCTISQIGHYEYHNLSRYQEKRTSLLGKLEFNFDALGNHNLALLAGADKVNSQFFANNTRQSIVDANNELNVGRTIDRNDLTPEQQQKFDQSGAKYIAKNRNPKLESENTCGNANECVRAPIDSNSYYIGFNNIYRPNKYFDFNFGARFDKQNINTQDPNITNKTYNNKSYNFGAAINISPDLSLLYKTAKGFRAPSFYELYNYNSTAAQHKNDSDVSFPKRAIDVKPETSHSNEYGVRYQNYWGDIEISAFNSRYKDMLDRAIPHLSAAQKEYCKKNLSSNQCIGNPPTPKPSDELFANLYNAKIKGTSLKVNLDLHSLTPKLPDGLGATLGYSKSKLAQFDYIAPKDSDGWYQASPNFWDAITPARYVVGLNFDHPSQTWGASTTLTHSKQKDENELNALRIWRGTRQTATLSQFAPKAYTLLDVAGYYSPTGSITARLGINNLLNTRYTTWEAARQLPSEAASTQATRYIAPGRSYFASFEMKF